MVSEDVRSVRSPEVSAVDDLASMIYRETCASAQTLEFERLPREAKDGYRRIVRAVLSSSLPPSLPCRLRKLGDRLRWALLNDPYAVPSIAQNVSSQLHDLASGRFE